MSYNESKRILFQQICPEFNAEAVQKVLDLLYTGSTWIGYEDNAVFTEMRDIIVTLGINFDIPDLDSVQTQVLNSTSEDQILEVTPSVHSANPKTMFNCNFCDKVFTVSFALSKHLKKHVSSQEKSNVQSKQATASSTKKRVTFDLTTYESSDMPRTPSTAPKFAKIVIEKLPTLDSNDDVTGHNLRTDSEPSSDESFEDYVGICCRHCDELYRKKDLVAHEEKCKKENDSAEMRKGAEDQNSENDSTASEADINGNAERSCFICGYKTTYKSNFFRHFVTYHYSEKLDEMFGPFDKIGCSLCSRKITSEKAWKSHLLMAHNVLPVSANDEGKKTPKFQKASSVKSKSNLNKLKIKIKGKKSSVIMACTKNDVSKNGVKKTDVTKKDVTKNHVTKKDVGKSYYCPKCPAVACSYTTLVRHLTLVHHRPELKPHVKAGDDGKNYHCGFCNKDFRAKTGAYLHVARVHEVPGALIPKATSLTKKTFKN